MLAVIREHNLMIIIEHSWCTAHVYSLRTKLDNVVFEGLLKKIPNSIRVPLFVPLPQYRYGSYKKPDLWNQPRRNAFLPVRHLAGIYPRSATIATGYHN